MGWSAAAPTGQLRFVATTFLAVFLLRWVFAPNLSNSAGNGYVSSFPRIFATNGIRADHVNVVNVPRFPRYHVPDPQSW